MAIQLSRKLARYYVSGRRVAKSHCKYLVIGAHPDDVEILGHRYAFIEKKNNKRRFFGVVVANGAGKKPRLPEHEKYSTTRLTNVRYEEQQEAARVAQYGGIWMLAYPSPSICNVINRKLVEELKSILLETQPEVVITHNALDAHPTHISVLIHLHMAIQELPAEKRPKKLLGGEGWGDISRWYVLLGQSRKAGVSMVNCSASLQYLVEILAPFQSQNGIMSYDDAVPNLLRTRAKLMNPHRRTGCKGVQVFFNMRQLLTGKMDPETYMQHLLKLHEDALAKNYRGYGTTPRRTAALKKPKK